MNKAYECDLEKVWYLKGCSVNLQVGDNFCAVGKLMKACNQAISYESTFAKMLGTVLIPYASLGTDKCPHTALGRWANYNNDVQMVLAANEQDAQNKHNKAFRLLLQICLKEGLITLKDSNLPIVKELRQLQTA